MVGNGFRKFFHKTSEHRWSPEVLALLEDGYTIYRSGVENSRNWIANGYTHRAADSLCCWGNQPRELNYFLQNCYYKEVNLDILEDLVEYLAEEGELID